jgi:hypothetical protein
VRYHRQRKDPNNKTRLADIVVEGGGECECGEEVEVEVEVEAGDVLDAN